MVLNRLKHWAYYLHPFETEKFIKNNKDKVSLKEGAVNVFLASLIPAVIALIVFTVMAIVFGVVVGGIVGFAENGAFDAGAISGGTMLMSGVGFAIAILVLGIVGWLIGNGVFFVLAKLLGGKGSYAEQAYFSSLILGGVNLLTPFYFIPCVGRLFSIVMYIYAAFLMFRTIRFVHGLNNIRAAAVILLPIVIVIVLVAAVFLFFGTQANTFIGQ